MNIKRIIQEEIDDFDWIREAKPYYGIPFMELGILPEVGTLVICIPGFNGENISYDDDKLYGGAGYKDGKVFMVGSIDSNVVHKRAVVWPGRNDILDNNYGVYLKALAPHIEIK